MRLDKYLSDRGFGTRKEVKALIQKGRVTVGGSVIKTPDYSVNEGQAVEVDGLPAEKEAFEYWILYKPAGYLSATEDFSHPVVTALIASKRKGLAPVGRLDLDTEGLLLLTNDGALSHRLLSPKNEIEKTYYAELDADLPADAELQFSEPMVFSDFTAKPAKAFQQLSPRSALLTITEGKFHQVKRMFAKIGCRVVYLRRERFSGITLQGLKPGEARRLKEDEISTLKAL